LTDHSEILAQWILTQNKDSCFCPYLFPNKRPKCA